MEIIEQSVHLIATLTLVLVVGVITMRLAEKLGVPDVVLLLLLGVALGPGLGLVDIPAGSVVNQTILLVGAAYILFHGGTDIDLRVISQVWKTLLLLATVGVLITAATVGAAAATLLGVPLMLAFLIGAVLAPTDPAALIPIFNQVKVRPKVSQTLISESTFNDATGASLVLVLVPVVLGTQVFSVGATMSGFLTQAGVGIIIGLGAGLIYVLSVAERFKLFYRSASKLSLVAALVAFVVADKLGGSGFMAAFIAGLIAGNANYLRLPIHRAAQEKLHHFMTDNTAMMRIFIFILLGAHVRFDLLAAHLWESLAIVAVLMFIARPLTILPCVLADRRGRWEWREIAMLVWSRETGVIPSALAGILVAVEVPQAEMIASIVFMAVLVTILLQATTTPWLARKLQILEVPKPERTPA